MPKAWKDCVDAKIKEGKSKDEAYAICTAWFKDKYGISPQEWHKKHSSKGSKEWVDNYFIKAKKDSIINSTFSSIVIEPDVNVIQLVTAAHVGGLEVLESAGIPTEESFINTSIASAGFDENPSDLMYITFALAHVGINKNRHEFLESEIRAAVATPVHKLLNWQHGEPNIGCITNSMIIEERETEPLHVAVAGAISCRKYPEFAEEIKNRYINKNLFTSMEAYFKTARCNICGGEFESQYDYCEHLRGIKFGSPKYPSAAQQLIGLCFAGAAVAVDKPADELSIVSNIKV
jgi:hypothetical protein